MRCEIAVHFSPSDAEPLALTRFQVYTSRPGKSVKRRLTARRKERTCGSRSEANRHQIEPYPGLPDANCIQEPERAYNDGSQHDSYFSQGDSEQRYIGHHLSTL